MLYYNYISIHQNNVNINFFRLVGWRQKTKPFLPYIIGWSLIIVVLMWITKIIGILSTLLVMNSFHKVKYVTSIKVLHFISVFSLYFLIQVIYLMKTEKKKTFLHPFIISIRGKDVNKREKYARNAPYSQNSLSIYQLSTFLKTKLYVPSL